MRRSVSAFVALLLVHAPLIAQSDAALQQIAEGWARGECNLLTHVAMNPETGDWQTVEDSPWSTWTIRRAGPTSVEYTMSDGTVSRVEFADGVYRDRAPEDADEPPSESEKHIVGHGIHGPENWSILLSGAQPPGNTTDPTDLLRGDHGRRGLHMDELVRGPGRGPAAYDVLCVQVRRSMIKSSSRK